MAGPIAHIHHHSRSKDSDRSRARASFDSVSSVWGITPLSNVPENPIEFSPTDPPTGPGSGNPSHRRFSVSVSQKNTRSQSYSVGQRSSIPFFHSSGSDFPGRLLPSKLCDDLPRSAAFPHLSDGHTQFGLDPPSGGFCLDGLGASSDVSMATPTTAVSATAAASTTSPWARSVHTQLPLDNDGAISIPTPTDSLWPESQKLSSSFFSTCRSPSDSNSVLSSVGYSPTEQAGQSIWSFSQDDQSPGQKTSAMLMSSSVERPSAMRQPNMFSAQSRRHSVAVPTHFDTPPWVSRATASSRPSVPNIYQSQNCNVVPNFSPMLFIPNSTAAPSGPVTATSSKGQTPTAATPLQNTYTPSVPTHLSVSSPTVTTPKPSRILYAVSFKCDRIDNYYLPVSSPLRPVPGQMVIVEGDRGFDLGMVTHADITVQQADSLKEQGIQASVRYLLGFSRKISGLDATRSDSDAGSSPSSNRAAAIERMVRDIMAKRAAILKFKSHSHPSANSPREPRYKAIRRLASPGEIAELRVMRELENKAIRICQSQADAMGKPMEILATEFQADYHKLTFYYYSNEYVDFNSLVKCLFRSFKTRLWMSAINPDSFAIMAEQKEEARMERERERDREKLERSSHSRGASKWSPSSHSAQEMVGLNAASSEFQRCSFASGSMGPKSSPSSGFSPAEAPNSDQYSRSAQGQSSMASSAMPPNPYAVPPSSSACPLSTQMCQMTLTSQGPEGQQSNPVPSMQVASPGRMPPWNSGPSHYHNPYNPYSTANMNMNVDAPPQVYSGMGHIPFSQLNPSSNMNWGAPIPPMGSGMGMGSVPNMNYAVPGINTTPLGQEHYRPPPATGHHFTATAPWA